jgi:DNA repair exonuclease SbcCD ATPase subunit
MTDETHEDLTLLAEWELRRDLQNHVAAERERIRELASLTHRLEQALRERDELKSRLAHAEADVEAERDLLKNHYSPEAAAKLRAELASARTEIEALKYPRAYLPPGEERSLALSAIMISQAETEIRALKAEVEMLRGVGCREVKADEPESGPCGVCLRCAEERGAEWAIRAKAQVVYALAGDAAYSLLAREVCNKAREKR